MSDVPPGMIIHDLADAVFAAGGELRGGEINFLASKPLVDVMSGLHYLAFPLDDNNGDNEYTALGVCTRQRARDLRDIIAVGGLMSVRVHHIGPPLDMLGEESPPGEPVHFTNLRTVFGHLTLHNKATERGLLGKFENSPRVRYSPPPLQATALPSFDAEGRVVHVHLICLDDNAERVSREEKERRMALFDQQTEKTKWLDGMWRGAALGRLH